MFKALSIHIIAIPIFALQLLRAVPAEGWRHAWKRLPLFFILWLVFSLLNVMHFIGHLLDELLFFRYRNIQIKKAVFILGIPRSGTTYLQRLLGKDKRFTTFTTWEALLAPSITEKYLYRTIGWVLRPLAKLSFHLRNKFLHTMDSIHKLALNEPEEDFLLLLPIQGCLLLAFLCPGSEHYWKLGFFDQKISPRFNKLVLDFYKSCLQKHLFFHGDDKILLSKNPSFTSLCESLLTHFPDANIIACTRNPAEAVPSQLSSLRPIMSLLGNGMLSARTQNKMIELLYSYYSGLDTLCHNNSIQKRIFVLPMNLLQSNLMITMTTIFSFLNLQAEQSFISAIEKSESQSGKYRSAHKYDLTTFSLTEKMINEKFTEVWPLKSASAAQYYVEKFKAL